MKRKLEVEFDDFGWDALTEEAERQGVAVEDVVYHAVMLYLAADPQSFSHQVPASWWQRRRHKRQPAD